MHGSCAHSNGIATEYTGLLERTHEPCVPTYARTINLSNRLLVHCQLKRGRTHEPCVPTCIRAARPIHHFTHQYRQCGYVEMHGSCVRSARNNQLANLFCRSLLTEMWVDARTVRPYMHSNSPPYPSFYTSIWTKWVCRDARFVRPFYAE